MDDFSKLFIPNNNNNENNEHKEGSEGNILDDDGSESKPGEGRILILFINWIV